MSPVRVCDLLPGDEVKLGGRSAVHVAHLVHPYWPDLYLVIWRLDDGTVSLDALGVIQEVGERVDRPWARRRAALLAAVAPGAAG